jgi:hypothetical protein
MGAVASYAALAAGCSSSSSNATSPVADAAAEGNAVGPSGEAGADGDAGGKLVAIHWKIVTQTLPGIGLPEAGADDAGSDGGDAGDGGSGAAPVEGAMICVYQNSAIPCATTDSKGEFTLSGLPAVTNVPLTLEKTGYYPEILAINTPGTDTDDTMYPQYLAKVTDETYLQPLGITPDTTKGRVQVAAIGFAHDAGLTGLSFGADLGAMISLSPMSGTGPFFVGPGNLYAPDAGSYVGLLATYFNVDPGNYTITVTDPVNDCEATSFPFSGNGYPGGAMSHKVLFPVVAGFTTVLAELCTQLSMTVSTDGGGGG